jgi:glutaredoxin 2
MQEQIEELDSQTQKLLIHYFEQVKEQTVERLSEWNKQTINYIKTMQDAINALSDVVDEIDGKIKQ